MLVKYRYTDIIKSIQKELAFVSHNKSNDRCKCALSLGLTDEI